MGFFSRLKDRLFKLDIDKINEKQTKKEKQQVVKVKLKNTPSKLENKQTVQRPKKQQDIQKYVTGLDKSSQSFANEMKELQQRHQKISQDFFDDLEETLVMADISTSLVSEIIVEIKKEVKKENVEDVKLISEIVADKIFTVYTNQSIVDTALNIKHGRKNVILVVGVNGSGKTTTIAKLASKLKADNYQVLLAAADTFRAGAVDQLDVWATRVGVAIVKPHSEGADPGSVVFEALQKLQTEDFNVLIIDTAGRLQNKVNLMKELEKINNIIQRVIPDGPHESLLVIDATTGQNGVSQAKHFKDVTNLTGIVLTKMDGTSKGGIVLTIKEKLGLAVKYMGLGEKINDLKEFDLDAFIYGMTQGLIDEPQT